MKREQFASKYDPSDEVRHLRSRVLELESKLDDRKTTGGLISEGLQGVLAAVPVVDPPEIYYKPPARSKASSPVIMVPHITDWHVGQCTKREHIEEFGEFNYSIAKSRVSKLLESLINKTQLARHAYTVDECHVIGTADWVSGNLHEELILTNEFPAPVQAVKAGFLLGSFLRGLSQHFKVVKADIVAAGNHDRLTRKRQYEGGGENSWGYIACEIAKTYLSECKNIDLRVHLPIQEVVQVGNQRYLIMHGDGMEGTWGIGYYGVERRKMREAMSRMNMDESKHFNRMVMGHMHSSFYHEHWIIGGSLSGTTAFDHGQGRHSVAHQTSWMLHPKHGEFDWTRWWL